MKAKRKLKDAAGVRSTVLLCEVVRMLNTALRENERRWTTTSRRLRKKREEHMLPPSSWPTLSEERDLLRFEGASDMLKALLMAVKTHNSGTQRQQPGCADDGTSNL